MTPGERPGLTGIASGATMITAALEEYVNDDPAAPGCTAQKMEGGYAISGTKICVSHAPGSARILLSARNGEELVVALVDPRAAGVTLNPQVVTTGDTRHELVMHKVQVPAADIVVVGGEALAAMEWAQLATRTALAAMALGACDKMMRITGSYTSEREQFGRAIAIRAGQATGWRIAASTSRPQAFGDAAGRLADRPGPAGGGGGIAGEDLRRQRRAPGQPGLPALPRRHRGGAITRCFATASGPARSN
ncbi:MAG: hypothetical protein R3E50_08590 [Halioglobus sp.]